MLDHSDTGRNISAADWTAPNTDESMSEHQGSDAGYSDDSGQGSSGNTDTLNRFLHDQATSVPSHLHYHQPQYSRHQTSTDPNQDIRLHPEDDDTEQPPKRQVDKPTIGQQRQSRPPGRSDHLPRSTGYPNPASAVHDQQHHWTTSSSGASLHDQSASSGFPPPISTVLSRPDGGPQDHVPAANPTHLQQQQWQLLQQYYTSHTSQEYLWHQGTDNPENGSDHHHQAESSEPQGK